MQTGVVAREKLFNMRMSAEEWERLDALARRYNLKAASVIRMLVKARCDELDAVGRLRSLSGRRRRA